MEKMMNNWFYLSHNLESNVWYKHKTLSLYFKYYLETEFNGTVDFISVSNKERRKCRATFAQLSTIDSSLFEKVKNEKTLQILYE